MKDDRGRTKQVGRRITELDGSWQAWQWQWRLVLKFKRSLGLLAGSTGRQVDQAALLVLVSTGYPSTIHGPQRASLSMPCC